MCVCVSIRVYVVYVIIFVCALNTQALQFAHYLFSYSAFTRYLFLRSVLHDQCCMWAPGHYSAARSFFHSCMLIAARSLLAHTLLPGLSLLSAISIFNKFSLSFEFAILIWEKSIHLCFGLLNKQSGRQYRRANIYTHKDGIHIQQSFRPTGDHTASSHGI